MPGCFPQVWALASALPTPGSILLGFVFLGLYIFFGRLRGSCCSTFVHIGALFSSWGGHQALSSVVTLGECWAQEPHFMAPQWSLQVPVFTGRGWLTALISLPSCTVLSWVGLSHHSVHVPVSLVVGKLLCAAAHSARGGALDPF